MIKWAAINLLNPSHVAPYVNNLYQQGETTGFYQLPHQLMALEADVATFVTPLGMRNLHFVFNPSIVSRVLAEPDIFDKSNLINRLRRFRGDEGGVFTARNKAWEDRRQITIDIFGPKQFETYKPLIQQRIDALLQKWETTGHSERPYDDLKDFVLETLLTIMFGESILSDRAFIKPVMDAMNIIGERALELVINVTQQMLRSTWGISSEMQHALHVFDAFMERLVADYADAPIMHRYLEVNGYYSGKHPQKSMANVKEDIFQIVFEAMETTTSGLFWTLQELAVAPHWQEKMATEIDAASAAPAGCPAHKATHDQRHKIFDAVTTEALRLHSAFAIALPRTARSSHTIQLRNDGNEVAANTVHRIDSSGVNTIYIPEFHISAKDILVFPLEVMNRSHDLYHHADAFDPQRHNHHQTRALSKKVAFLSGKHVCTGKELYLLIADMLLHSLLSKHEIARTGSDEIPVHYGTAVAPHMNAENTGLLFTNRFARPNSEISTSPTKF